MWIIEKLNTPESLSNWMKAPFHDRMGIIKKPDDVDKCHLMMYFEHIWDMYDKIMTQQAVEQVLVNRMALTFVILWEVLNGKEHGLRGELETIYCEGLQPFTVKI